MTSNPAPSADYRSLLKRAYLEIKELQSKLSSVEQDRTEPIAIIGLGCRFPGGANDPESFWRLLRDGVDAITEVPADRWDAATFYDPAPGVQGRGVQGKMRTRWGGFLSGVDRFDAGFFGIAPREAARMDPQQRLWLEVAWEALEAAGQTPEQLAGSNAGVFAAICSSDYSRMALAEPDAVDAYDASGGAESILANRLSYLMDLRGPSVAVDTACSSSLVAVHLACQSLRSRECSIAIAGGVNLILSPAITISLSSGGMLAPDGRCKTFDSRADGYVRSEGCGAVVLKRLSDALAGGAPIRALIRGSAVNQDGRSNGLTAPSLAAQEAVLRQALANAGVTPEQVSFIETHGTGTMLGDPIEVEALTAVYGRPRSKWCALGAAKASLGHLEGAAGIAGLIKVVLALEHGAIPPQLHFRSLNPNISLERTPFVIPTRVLDWPADDIPRAAGLSSFGFGGTNAHIVLQEAPRRNEYLTRGDDDPPYLLPLSARHPEALRAMARSYAELPALEPLHDVCYTASVRRGHHAHRLAVLAHSSEQMRARLAEFGRGRVSADLVSGSAAVFVFAGQGTQWPGMGLELIDREPVFRSMIEQCDALITKGAGWSLMDELRADASQSRLEHTEFAQPTQLAIQVALAALWRSWGIEPQAVAGHSAGEVAAAHVAGVLTLADAVLVALNRGRLMQRAHGQGRMAAANLTFAEAREIAAVYADRLSVAAINSPVSVVFSGERDALAEVLKGLDERGVRSRLLDVPYAFHSSQMRRVSAALVEALAGLTPETGAVPIFSTLTGSVRPGREFGAEYWGRQVWSPVRFGDAITNLIRNSHRIFLEIGSHPVLGSAVGECLSALQQEGAALPSLRRSRPQREVMLSSLGRLYTLGCDVKWAALYPEGGRCIPLPSYPWQRSRYWLETNARARKNHKLLGERVYSPVTTQVVFESRLSVDAPQYLNDHRIHGMAVVPAVVYLEMILSAAVESLGPGPWIIEDVVLREALVLPAVVQVIITPEDASFQIFSRIESEASWRLHATGKIRVNAVPAPIPPALAALQTEFHEAVTTDEFYQMTRDAGFEFGPSFQGIVRLWRKENESLGEIQAAAEYPPLFDAALQVAIAGLPTGGAHYGELYVPLGIDQYRFHRPPRDGRPVWSHARLRPEDGGDRETLVADIRLLDDSGCLVAEVEGLRLKRASREALFRALRDPSPGWYEVSWSPADRGPTPRAGFGPWLILADRQGVGAKLAVLLQAQDESVELTFEGFEPRPYGVVVYLGGLDAAVKETSTAAELQEVEKQSCGGLLELIQTLQTGRLWIVTRGALAQAPLVGLGRVIALEHPDLWGGLVELGADASEEDAAVLLHEILESDGEDHVAFRQGQRFVPRLVHRTGFASRADLLVCAGSPDPASGAGTPRADREVRPTFLITGGLGGLGLLAARWLVEQGVRHLALIGRGKPSTAAQSTVGELEQAGAQVLVIQADVSQESQVGNALSEIAKTLPPVRGVFHLAGVLDDGVLLKQDWQRFSAVLSPKISGAWNLHRLTRALTLDCFVMFSSAVALLGAAGQSNYAAANAFLDALAHHRRSLGLPATSINWGPWAEAGMAAEDGPRWLARGVEPIPPDRAFDTLGRLLRQEACQAAVLSIQWPKFLERFGGKTPPLLREVAAAEGRQRPALPPVVSSGILRRLAEAAPSERRSLLEVHVCQLSLSVLGIDPSSSVEINQGFTQMGMDSLMAVELKNALQTSLGKPFPSTLIFDYPTVDRLTGYLAEVLNIEPPAPLADDPVAALLGQVQSLSAEELSSLLGEELAAE